MNPRPPQSPHSLDAEERALAKALPRLHGRTAPGPDLDASILAAAQAAVLPAKPARANARPRIRWIAPAALAASMVLAVGMAWQLRPLPSLQGTQQAAVDDVASERAVLMIEPAASDKAVPKAVMQSTQVPALPARKQTSTAASSAQQGPPVRDDRAAAVPVLRPSPTLPSPASASPPPHATLAAKAPPPIDSQAGALQTQATQDGIQPRASAPAAAANAAGMAKAAASDKAASMAHSPWPATGSPARAVPAVPAQVSNEATTASDATFVDDPEVDIPPATAASPDVRDAWLRRITQLLEQGKLEDAKASLAEFKRRYPNAVLPPALKALDLER
ncbi:MAG: hypothetical protein ABIO61_00105 [Thermomonas sp.]